MTSSNEYRNEFGRPKQIKLISKIYSALKYGANIYEYAYIRGEIFEFECLNICLSMAFVRKAMSTVGNVYWTGFFWLLPNTSN